MGADSAPEVQHRRPEARAYSDQVSGLVKSLVGKVDAFQRRPSLAQVKEVLVAQANGQVKAPTSGSTSNGETSRNALLPLLLLSAGQKLTEEQQALRAARATHVLAALEGARAKFPCVPAVGPSSLKPDHEP